MSRMRTQTGQIVQMLCYDDYKLESHHGILIRPWQKIIRRICKMIHAQFFFNISFGKNRTNARIFSMLKFWIQHGFWKKDHTKIRVSMFLQNYFIKHLYLFKFTTFQLEFYSNCKK